jgi:hypothetical protein
MDKGRRSAGSDGRDRPQRRGFRGTAENAKTKICQRCAALWVPGRLRRPARRRAGRKARSRPGCHDPIA